MVAVQDNLFHSYALHGEDVVLWRVFSSVRAGRYIEAGSPGETGYSLSRSFHEHGWIGLLVDPPPASDDVDEVGSSTDSVTGRAVIRGNLGSLGCDGREVHFAAIHQPLESGGIVNVSSSFEVLNAAQIHPWVVIVKAQTSEFDAASLYQSNEAGDGYLQTMFDGLWRWYVRKELAGTLAPRLSYPACSSDRYTTPWQREWDAEKSRYQESVDSLIRDVSGWRAKSLSTWFALQAARNEADALEAKLTAAEVDFESRLESLRKLAHAESARLEAELKDVHSSTSWKATAPMRKFSSLLKRRP
jgi:hypothetical protein